MTQTRQRLLCVTFLAGLVLGLAGEGLALTMTGTVDQKYVVTGRAVSGATQSVLKLKFESKTAGTNLTLCASTLAEFGANTCALQLSGSGGPGFMFVTITNTVELNGKIIWVRNNGPVKPATFELSVE